MHTQFLTGKREVDFVNSELQYNNIKVSTKKNKIQVIDEFIKFLRTKYGNEIPLKQVGREDFIDFQASKRKPESIDPFHKWIGTYNQFLRNLKPFFKYIYHPDLPPIERKLPDFIKGMNPLKRKEKTCYTASDMWTEEDDELFLKYCENPTIRLYHMLSRDFSNRPAELLRKRICDFTEEVDVNGKPYMTTTIGEGGKTTIREVGALKGHAYYVEYIQKYHPTPTDPKSFLFRNRGKKFHYRNSPIKTSTLDSQYWKLRKIFFPRLLESPEVPTNDKVKIKVLLKKPWKPYVRRHTGLTDKAQSPQVPFPAFVQHGGWTEGSKMPWIYIHQLSHSSRDAVLSSWDIETKTNKLKQKPVLLICSCGTDNKQNAKYCVGCRRVLSYEGMQEIQEEKKREQRDMNSIIKRLENAESILAQVAAGRKSKVKQINSEYYNASKTNLTLEEIRSTVHNGRISELPLKSNTRYGFVNKEIKVKAKKTNNNTRNKNKNMRQVWIKLPKIKSEVKSS